MPEPIHDYVMLPHALRQMKRRGITQELVGTVLEDPDQREAVRAGRDVLQARVMFGPRQYLIRVFVDIDQLPAEVVSVYRTSKIARHWRLSS